MQKWKIQESYLYYVGKIEVGWRKGKFPIYQFGKRGKCKSRVYIISAKFISAGETGNSAFINLTKEENARVVSILSRQNLSLLEKREIPDLSI
ncbi:MAG: hypothetical protein F6K40_25420 [Okeania sp. SIO3I5]|uniref:hypothetical protein n=1 Tax=Okeania sp. SIO3I5 TaxID=2607805 RepID=UPI0013BB7E15|nr:hypothetical protein [Okeania sp. SIO3I5]NEQ39413.1 hypothetical protein [Okeania sp. SIO3I5]